MRQRMTTKYFISKALVIHDAKYQYDEVYIIDSKTKVKINCPSHGMFIQQPSAHLMGNGCPKCGFQTTLAAVKISNENKRICKDTFIQRAIKIHGNKYDYSNILYVDMKTKINICCTHHGVFRQSPTKHIDKSHPTGCPTCGGRPIITTGIFVERATNVHGDMYDYSKVMYKSYMSKVEIICKIHGLFKQAPDNHVSKKQGCPMCKREASSLRGIGIYNENTINPNDTGTLYFVLMTNENEQYYKIGITKNNAVKRLKHHGYNTSIICEIKGKLIDMYKFEQQILHKMKNYRYKYKPLNLSAKRCGWTEYFQYSYGDILTETFNSVIDTQESLFLLY